MKMMMMMMMMAIMMTFFWPPNLLNLCHYYPKYMMLNHQMMIFWTFPVTGEFQTNISLITMLNAHLEHEARLTGSPLIYGPTHCLSDLQPRHSSLALAFTAPMNSYLQSNQLMLETLLISIQTQLSSPLETLLHGNPTSSENYNDLICSPNLWILIQTPTSGVALPSSTTSFTPATRMTSTPKSRPSGQMGRTCGSGSMHYESKTLIP